MTTLMRRASGNVALLSFVLLATQAAQSSTKYLPAAGKSCQSLRGNRIVNVVPVPSADSTSMVPECAVMTCSAM